MSINNLDSISKIDNIEIQDGDDIYIPKIADFVGVIGEVYNEQSFIYRDHKKAPTPVPVKITTINPTNNSISSDPPTHD